MRKLSRVAMQLIGYEACGIPMDALSQEVLSDDFCEQLYRLSKSQDLAHLVGSALAKQKAMPAGEIGAKFEKQMFTAAFRYQRLNYEYLQMCALFEREAIAFVPLKGSVIREYYPEPWMRTSCDIDILVREQDLERAVALLQSELSYRTDGERGYHDISLFSQSGIHLELHFNILEDMEGIDRLLSRVWE